MCLWVGAEFVTPDISILIGSSWPQLAYTINFSEDSWHKKPEVNQHLGILYVRTIKCYI